MTDNQGPHGKAADSGGRALLRNTFFNLLGQGAPIVVALLAVPMLIRHLGTDRFGVLTLSWMVIGYFSLFDFGLGRAMTKLIAEKLGAGRPEEVPGLFWTSMYLMGLLGAAGALLIFLLAPWLVSGVLNIPAHLQAETLHSLYVLALSIPVVIITTGLKGLLEAYQRFGLVNIVRVPMGMFMYLGPLLVFPFSHSLFPVVTVLSLGRVIAFFVHAYLCYQVVPALCAIVPIRRESAQPLLCFGGWMTVTNIISPLMVYLDRFLIGGLVSVTAVAYYCTPYEVVTKLWFVPTALVGVLFPAFSMSFGKEPTHTTFLFRRSVKYMFLIIFPCVLLMMTFAPEGLELWLGAEFSRNSTLVLQILALGIFINCLAQVPYTLIQSAGRPDITAKLHLAELPFYVAGTWYLVQSYGINGAAIMWLVRVAVDTLLLFGYACRFLSLSLSSILRMSLAFGAAISITLLAFLPLDLAAKSILVSLELAVYALLVWFYSLSAEERFFCQWRRQG
jgi:O-antigen/teichoic acid export membrane protein